MTQFDPTSAGQLARRPILGGDPRRGTRPPPRCTATSATTTAWRTRAPSGRARAPPAWPRRRSRRPTRSTPRTSRSRTGSPSTWSGSCASSGSSRTTSGSTCSGSSTRWAGRRRCCPAGHRSSRPTRPSGSSASWPGCAPTRRYMAANIELLHEGIASGLTAPRIVTERTIAQLERLLETPAEESVIAPGRQGRRRSRPRAGSRRSSATSVMPGRSGLPRGAPGRLPAGQPRGSRASGRRPNGDALLPDPDPGLDDARARARGGPPDRPRGARADRDSSGG